MKECEQGVVAHDRLHHSCCGELKDAELQIGELRKFIERYGQHDRECSNNHPSPCSCGYDERLARLEDTEKRVEVFRRPIVANLAGFDRLPVRLDEQGRVITICDKCGGEGRSTVESLQKFAEKRVCGCVQSDLAPSGIDYCEKHKPITEKQVESIDRRDKNKKPRPEMYWSDKHGMWVDPDTRTPDEKARHEEMAKEAEKRVGGPKPYCSHAGTDSIIHRCTACGEEWDD